MSLYQDSGSGIGDMLQEGVLFKQYINVVTNTYAASPDGPIDHFIHPSLRPEGPSLVSDLAHNEASSSTAPVPANEEVKAEEDAFKEAMRKYESTAKDKYKTGIDPDGEHTVRQLELLVEESIKNCKQKDSKGFWSKIGLAYRKLGQREDDVNDWLGMLPSECQYLSVVCGGLKLILKAAARLKYVHETALDALERIPTIINGAQRVLTVFGESERLKSLSRTFYLSVLTALGHILKYLNDKVQPLNLKKVALIFQPTTFERDLVEKIIEVTKWRTAFNEEADICHKELNLRMHHNNNETMDGIQEIRQEFLFASREQSRVNGLTTEKLEAIQRKQSELCRNVANLHSIVMELLLSGDSMQKFPALMHKTLDSLEDDYDRETRLVIATSRGKGTAITPKNHRRQLLSQLDYDRNAIRVDLTSTFSLGPTLSRDNQERSVYLIKSHKLEAWLKAERSTTLFVNGNVSNVQRRSGLTFVCSRLVFALESIRSPVEPMRVERPDIVPLYFFCGEHASYDHSWETPSGVVNSLLVQLLTHCKSVDVTKAVGLGTFRNDSVKAVFKRFARVLAQVVKDTTVFCIIDGLPFYLDKRERSGDAEELIRQLLNLAREKKSRKRPYVFKLLLTALHQFHTPEMEKLDDDSVLTLPQTLPYTGGFTAMKWHYCIGQELESLAEAE